MKRTSLQGKLTPRAWLNLKAFNGLKSDEIEMELLENYSRLHVICGLIVSLVELNLDKCLIMNLDCDTTM